MAKDILRFHCVYWPAMLLAAGLRRAEADLRPRLPAARRPQDLEVARQRRSTRSTLIDVYGADARALLVRARGLVRAGRQRVARRHRRALRARARQRPRQPALADDRDDRRATATGRLPGGPDDSPEIAAAIAARAAGERRHRRVRHHRRARARSGRSSARSTGTSTETKPWELAKDEANAERARPGALRPRRRPAGRGGRALRVPAGDGAEDPRRARPAAGARLGAGRLRAARRRPTAIEAAPPLFPRIELPDADAA